MFPSVISQKNCGDCTACCSVSHLLEIGNRDSDSPSCKNLTPNGCSVYDNRPKNCRSFSCEYVLSDMFPGLKRPDQNGLIFARQHAQINALSEKRENILIYIKNYNYDVSQLELFKNIAADKGFIVLEFEEFLKLEQKVLVEEIENTRSALKILKKEIKLEGVNEYEYIELIRHFLNSSIKLIRKNENASALIYYRMGLLFFDHKLFLEANLCLETALQKNLGKSSFLELKISQLLDHSYRNSNYSDKSIHLLEKTINFIESSNAVVPPAILISMATALHCCNKKDESEEMLISLKGRKDLNEYDRKVIEFNMNPHHFRNHNVSLGFYSYGVLGYELGIHKKTFTKEEIGCHNREDWSGEIVPGAILFCLDEAGIGDSLLMIRFAKKVAELNMRPIWITNTGRGDLVDLLRTTNIEIVDDPESLRELYTSLPNGTEVFFTNSFAIPYHLNVKEEELWSGSYIDMNFPEQEIKAHNIIKQSGNSCPKIGIKWAGNPLYENDLHRSLPVDQLYKNLNDIDATFYSLQKEFNSDIEKFPGIVDLSQHMEKWADTIGCIKNLDIVITSCTSIAHAAALTGVTTFVLVPIISYFPWQGSAEISPGIFKTPWYGDNVTVFKQETIRSWEEPIQYMKKYLQSYLQNK